MSTDPSHPPPTGRSLAELHSERAVSGTRECCWCDNAVLEGQVRAGEGAGGGVRCPVLLAAADSFRTGPNGH